MEILTLAVVVALGLSLLRAADQRRRIALLGRHLAGYDIERLMEQLTDGYLRCLGEDDPERRAQIWGLLDSVEARLASQFERFVAEFAAVDAGEARISRLPFALPFAARLLPAASFDARRAFAIHAQGLQEVMHNRAGRTPKAKAYTMTAEFFLMQHTCHWFCRSKAVASARMLARHKTSHAQLVESVSAKTRRDYLALIGG